MPELEEVFRRVKHKLYQDCVKLSVSDYVIEKLMKGQSETEDQLNGNGRLLTSKEESVINEVVREFHGAMETYPAMTSPHEGWAIIQEEMDELWEIVRLKPTLRDRNKMREEARQIAAMAIRYMVDLC